MVWLVTGQLFGFFLGFIGLLDLQAELWIDVVISWYLPPVLSTWCVFDPMESRARKELYLHFSSRRVHQVSINLIIAIPRLGEFVVVGQMLAAHGSCSAAVS